MSKRLLVLLLFAALHARAQDLDQYAAIACPAAGAHELTAGERAVLAAVLKHYRQADASQKSPQFVLRYTLRYQELFDAEVKSQLQRHGLDEGLLRELRARNASAFELALPKSFPQRGLTCKDVLMMGYGVDRSTDVANLATAVAVSLPAFDAGRKRALVLALNDAEYVTEQKLETLGLILLRAAGRGEWQIEWHEPLRIRFDR